MNWQFITCIAGGVALVWLLVRATTDPSAEKRDTYAMCAVLCTFALIGLLVWGLFARAESLPRYLYDVEVRMHYIDGYAQTVRKDSIKEDELPRIVEKTVAYGSYPTVSYRSIGTYSLYLGNSQYHGVIRYELLHFRKYRVPLETYRETNRRK